MHISKKSLNSAPNIIKILVLIFFIAWGARVLYGGHLLTTKEFSTEPSFFLKTLQPSYSGQIMIKLTPTQAFIIGDNITAEIKIRLFNIYQGENKTCVIELMFPDAITRRDIPPYTTQQDWTFLLSESYPYGTDAIYEKNVTLLYAYEGIYGLNMTVWRFDVDSRTDFYFANFVLINSFTFIEEKIRSNLMTALNVEVLGLALIAIGPIIVQLVDLIAKSVDSTFKKKKLRKTQKEKTKEQEEETEEPFSKTILRLIRLVDCNEANLFKTFDIFRGELTFPFTAFILILILTEIFLFFGIASAYEKIVVALSFLAFAITYISLMAYFGEKSVVNINFKRLEICVKENEKPLLKALIKMKAKNREFDLEEIYKQNPLMFEEKKILERLYK